MGTSDSRPSKLSRSQLCGFIRQNCDIIKEDRLTKVRLDEDDIRSAQLGEVQEESGTENIPVVWNQLGENDSKQHEEVPILPLSKIYFDIKQCQFIFLIQGCVSSSRVRLWKDRLKTRFSMTEDNFRLCVPDWKLVKDIILVGKFPLHICIVVDPHVASANIRDLLCSNQNAVDLQDNANIKQNKHLKGLLKRTRSIHLESDKDKAETLKLVDSLEIGGALSFHSPELLTTHLLDMRVNVVSLDISVCRVDSKYLLRQVDNIPVAEPAEELNIRCNKGWFYNQSGKPPLSKRKRVSQPVLSPLKESPLPCSPLSTSPPRSTEPAEPIGNIDFEDSEGGGVMSEEGVTKHFLKPQAFACQRPQTKTTGLNSAVTANLCQIAEVIHSSKTANSEYRSRAYKNLALRVSRFPKVLTCAEELNEQMPKLNAKMLSRVNAAISGKHPVLEEGSSSTNKVVQELQGIWGVGQSTAAKWAAQGITSVDELRHLVLAGSPRVAKLKMSRCQKIGLNRYDDLLDRMSRAEAQSIGERVRAAVELILPGCEVVQCGSFRRGKSMCGDVDMLISPPVGYSSLKECEHLLTCSQQSPQMEGNEDKEISLFMSVLISSLGGFITDTLTVSSGSDTDSFMGVCKLNTETLHRRLDIKCYTRKALPFAILYFTGSAHFNRSMRLWAKKQGWKLLDTCIVRANGDCDTSASSVDRIRSEKDIFRFLGLEYRSPVERDVSNVSLVSTTNEKEPSGAYRAQKRI